MVGLGAGLFHYATYDSSFTHATTGALIAGLLLVGDRVVAAGESTLIEWRSGGKRSLLLIAVLCFWLVLTRNPLVLVVGGLGFAWAIRLWASSGPARGGSIARLAVPMGLGAAVALAIQFSYNWFLFGKFTLSSYANEGFSLSERHQFGVLFSWSKGIFNWYPIVGLALAAALVGRRWHALVLLAATVAPLVVLYGAWHDWGLGGGFGHRGFVELSAVYALVLGDALASRRWLRKTVVVAGVLCAIVSLGLMRAYWRADIGFSHTTRPEWIRHGIGESSIPPVVIRWAADLVGR